ncbi:MAG: hypothetical protein J6T26_07705 [Firmicutes bacterium]|nr:hypothetical protein [Bacillota bacterium]
MAYGGRFFIRRRVWRCGPYAEVELYPVFQPPGKRRSKCRPTRECQARLNQRDAVRKLARLLQANFRAGDYEIDLTFAEPESVEGAVTELKKLLRALRKIWRAEGTELRYVYTCEQGKKSGRVHFHLVLNAGPLSRDEIESMWKHGYANARRLRMDESGVSGLANYISKQGQKRKPEEAGKRRWSCSRNLVRPVPEVTDGAVTVGACMALAEEIDRRSAGAVMEGMTLVEAEALRNRVNRGLYLRFEMAEPETWHGRRPVARYFSGELGEVEDCSG